MLPPVQLFIAPVVEEWLNGRRCALVEEEHSENMVLLPLKLLLDRFDELERFPLPRLSTLLPCWSRSKMVCIFARAWQLLYYAHTLADITSREFVALSLLHHYNVMTSLSGPRNVLRGDDTRVHFYLAGDVV